jgi:7,8-dihydro-6-hydroxymethylpterin-pyrophosphokinase
VLEPLAELIPQQVHPGLRKTIKALLESLADTHKVRKMEGFTLVST